MLCTERRGFTMSWMTYVLLAVTVSSGVFAQEKENGEAADGKDVDYALMRMFVETFEQIDRNYVNDVDHRMLVEAAIRGMIKELDQYSSYIAPDEVAHFRQSVDQEFGGVGIQVHIDQKTRRLSVMTPLPGTPAYKSGVRAGDIVMEIEGESTEGVTINQAVRRLKGKPGEAVTIGVRHLGETEIEQITIVRDIIRVSTVLGDRYGDGDKWNFMLDDEKKIGYVRLTHFSRRSSAELAEAMRSLRDQGMKGMVLDLRYNPGGLLSQATAISDMFVRSGTIVSTEGRNTEKRVWEARSAGTYADFPMAVIVNRGSASASEIVSACLQDNERAVVVGERTWGKGSVQNVIQLEQGASALKLTTAKYLRPSGKNIHRFPNMKEDEEWGVSPDDGFEVKLTPEEQVKYIEYRRSRDVIGGDATPDSEFQDRPLNKALEYVVSQLDVDQKEASDEKSESADDAGDRKADASSPADGDKDGGDDAAAFAPRPELAERLPHAA